MEFVPGPRNTKIVGLHRVQIPKMIVSRENLNYGYLDFICTSPEFIEFWKNLEEKCNKYSTPTYEWRSSLDGSIFKAKFDDKTHIFDENLNLIDPLTSFVGETITCLLEIKSVYNFKNSSGITFRIHQMKIHSKKCLL